MRVPSPFISVCCAAILVAACATTSKEQFYTLNAVASLAGRTAATIKPQYSVSVGPVKVPEIVDRPQLVIRRSPNRVEILEQHRWAESLRTEIARVLAADLGIRLNNAQVTSAADYASRNADYRILVDIEQFDGIPGEAATVQAIWTIRRISGDVSKTGRSLVREPVRNGGYDELAAAYGRTLATIAIEIGNAVQSMQGAEQKKPL